MRRIHVTIPSTALGTIAFLATLLLAPAAEADPQAARSRSSASASSSSGSGGATSSASRSSGSSSVSRGSSAGRAAVTRSSGRAPSPGSRTAVRGTSRHRAPGSFHGHRPHRGPWTYYGGHYYPYYPYWGLSVGLGWWGGGYYSPYYSPYYGLGSYYAAPYYPYYGKPRYTARIQAEPVGAFDLNVKPKKTEVWVDGRFVGTAGRFDGFPDYLWLSEGDHQLVFFLEGYVTVERQVRTLAGVVSDLRVDMERGASVPARQLAERPSPPPLPSYPPRSETPAPEARAEAERPETPAAAESPSAPLDVRAAPGRLVLSVAPADASVYLDGRYLGTGRDLERLHAGLLVESGDHRLEIVRPGFTERTIDFSVAAGEEERIEVGLDAAG